ncbi:helix-turn-helix transcriptional regulator [Lysinibacillus capsici]|uniref:helix-turn-helix transcriptional regulator n=1 Tax=Lysinibacillus capsici TaxID=2115968 RepID=UPI0028BEB416|nr:helix-turn-helix transcriptional regulator [Lysinibacillus capsici]WNN77736.1 helix-turn-helix transcriptional regulator [Lysinibacillus capsici]
MSLEKLKKLRTREKLTYQQVADYAGISKEYYWFIENGKRRLTYEMAIKIAKVFNKKPDDIFFEQ